MPHSDPEVYHRNLPHIQPAHADFFVTCRLAGSLPTSVLQRLRRERTQLRKEPASRSLTSLSNAIKFKEFDAYLDAGTGPLWLRDPSVANIVHLELLLQEQYELIASTIMPNHIHLVLSPYMDAPVLFRILQTLKRRTARACNELLQRRGAFWQHESYDHIIRSGRIGHAIDYVLQNPVKAGLCKHWKDWPWTYLSPTVEGFD